MINDFIYVFFRSFVPPVRDEEHEIQRKAHAKRVRETRRSTQGVTLEDLKSAEQLVKKKQQQENAARTTELQQLVINSPAGKLSTHQRSDQCSVTNQSTVLIISTNQEAAVQLLPAPPCQGPLPPPL